MTDKKPEAAELPKTPTLDRMDYSEIAAIRDFLEHLSENDLCVYNKEDCSFVDRTSEEWFCAIHNIDPKLVESERGKLILALHKLGV